MSPQFDEVRIHLAKWCAAAMEGPEVKDTGVTLVNLLDPAHSYDTHVVAHRSADHATGAERAGHGRTLHTALLDHDALKGLGVMIG